MMSSSTSLQPLSEKLINHAGEILPPDALTHAPVVLYYVAGKWCPHCTNFNEELIQFYNTINEKEKKLEILYLSIDASESDFKAQIATFPWLAVPFDHNQAVRKFLNENEITIAPSVLLVRREDGRILKRDCRGDIHKNPTGCYNEWVNLLHEVSIDKHSNVNESKISHKSLAK